LNGRYADWNAARPTRTTKSEKQRLIDESVAALEKYIPGVARQDRLEGGGHAADDRALHDALWRHVVRHQVRGAQGFDGPLGKPPGLYHAGSVGIIMSGWLGTINYGVITANKIDKALVRHEAGRRGRSHRLTMSQVTDLIPHRPPFLFVDEIVSESADGLVARRTFRADEDFYQAGTIRARRSRRACCCAKRCFRPARSTWRAGAMAGQRSKDGVPLLAKISDVRFRNPVYPGDTITIEVKKEGIAGWFHDDERHVKCADGTNAC
jgi:3-hydroxyacyl-[acyl-carrier-protein] dehydratase